MGKLNILEINISIKLLSEDKNKIERLVTTIISKSAKLTQNEVRRKNKMLRENTINVDYEYNSSIKRI